MNFRREFGWKILVKQKIMFQHDDIIDTYVYLFNDCAPKFDDAVKLGINIRNIIK